MKDWSSLLEPLSTTELVDLEKAIGKVKRERLQVRRKIDYKDVEITSFKNVKEILNYFRNKFNTAYFIPKSTFAVVDTSGVHYILITASPYSTIPQFTRTILTPKKESIKEIKLLNINTNLFTFSEKERRYFWLKYLVSKKKKVSSYGFKNFYPTFVKEEFPDLFVD